MHNSEREPWLSWAMELQALAQNGLAYTRDDFDRERFGRIREIAAEMLSYKSGISPEAVRGLFCGEIGYQTPKLDTRAAVFRGGEILLVREHGLWALPGGWVDVDESIRSNAAKEVREEAGLEVRPLRLIALQRHDRHNIPPHAHAIIKVFVLCEFLGGAFRENLETQACGFFPQDALPPLAINKTTAAQIAMCFAAKDDPHWAVQFE